MRGAAVRATGREGVTVREAYPADCEGLLELTRACPMQGDVALRIDRDPDFFALSRCRGVGFTLVAEAGGSLVGCLSVARRPAYLGGTPDVMGYIGDVKIHPAHRREGLARKLLAEAQRLESAAPPAFYVGSTAAGNEAVDRLLSRLGRNQPVAQLGRFVSHQLLPILHKRMRPPFDVMPARVEDEEELVTLLDDAHRRYAFGPVFRNGGLREILARSPGMSLEDYLVARRGSRIVAAVGIWGQTGIKQTHVLRMTRAQRWLSAAVTAGARIGLPRLPREGEALRFRYARHAAGDPAGVRAILRAALGETRARKDHFLLFTCAEGDPVARSVAGIPRTTFRYGLVVGSNRPRLTPDLERLRACLPFDDAALA